MIHSRIFLEEMEEAVYAKKLLISLTTILIGLDMLYLSKEGEIKDL